MIKSIEVDHNRVYSKKLYYQDENESCCGKIKLRNWEDCKNLSSKIGFIIGQAIEFALVNTTYVIKKAVQIFHLDDAARLFFNTFNKVINKFLEGAKSIFNCLINPLSSIKTKTPVKAKLALIQRNNFRRSESPFQKVLSQALQSLRHVYGICKDVTHKIFKGLKKLSDHTIVPLYHQVLCPIGKYAVTLFKKSLPHVKQTLNATVNYIFVPLYNQVLSPALKKLNQLAHRTINEGAILLGKVLRPLGKWVIKPAFNQVITPFFKNIFEFLDGMIGGIFGDKTNNIVRPSITLEKTVVTAGEPEDDLDSQDRL